METIFHALVLGEFIKDLSKSFLIDVALSDLLCVRQPDSIYTFILLNVFQTMNFCKTTVVLINPHNFNNQSKTSLAKMIGFNIALFYLSTQSTLYYEPHLHSYKHFYLSLSALYVTFTHECHRSNLGFTILPTDTSAYRLEQLD